MDCFVHYNFLNLPTHVYSSVSEISSHSNFDLPFSDFLILSSFSCASLDIFRFLWVEASHSICSCTNHFQ